MKSLIWVGSVTALFSSALTLSAYKFLLEQPYPVREIIRETPSNTTTQEQQAYALQVAGPRNLPNFTEAAQRVRLSVVHIRSTGGEDLFSFEGLSSGSGVIVSSDGYIISNNHVVEGASTLNITLHDRRVYKAKIIGTDPTTDLALLKITDPRFKDQSLPALSFSNSDEVQIGQWVLAVGNPFNLSSTVTAGIVSAKGRNIDILKSQNAIESFIQTDAAVNPGNSGGALVNTQGQLVGINTAIVTRSGRYEGYSFAIPANLVKKIMEDLMEYGEVRRGFLGVRVRDLTMEQMDKLQLKNLEGVFVTEVNDGSAAKEAGLGSGDVILRINGNKINSAPELQEQVALFRPENQITVEYFREGKTYEVDVTLKGDAADEALLRARQNKKKNNRLQDPKTILEDLGLNIRPMTEEESQRLGKKGLWVTSIKRGSIAQGTNMQKNFLITSINDKPVENIEELRKLLAEANAEVMIRGIYEKENGEFTYSFDK